MRKIYVDCLPEIIDPYKNTCSSKAKSLWHLFQLKRNCNVNVRDLKTTALDTYCGMNKAIGKNGNKLSMFVTPNLEKNLPKLKFEWALMDLIKQKLVQVRFGNLEEISVAQLTLFLHTRQKVVKDEKTTIGEVREFIVLERIFGRSTKWRITDIF